MTGVVAASGATAAMLALAEGAASAPNKDSTPAPKYFPWHYQSSLNSPLPAKSTKDGLPTFFKQEESFNNAHGKLGSWSTSGSVNTATNAFFQSLGTNGRTCFSCHRPADAMSISAASIRLEFRASQGRDPIFAPVDGANCPSQVPAEYTSKSHMGGNVGKGTKSLEEAYSLLLNKGLFRIFLPVPDNAQFTVKVLSDPYGCNTDPTYATATVNGVTKQMVSVYRRPRMSANLKFTVDGTADALGLPKNLDLLTGELLTDPATGAAISGNIMWDGREPTLKSQARSATMGHAQALNPPTEEQLKQIVDLESAFFLAQDSMKFAGKLNGPTAGSVFGGPQFMSAQPPTAGFLPGGGFKLYDAWDAPAAPNQSTKDAQRASIARGQKIFNTRSFTVAGVAGFNDAVGNFAQAQCITCHGTLQSGSEVFARGQRAIGIGGPSPLGLSNDLPLFELTCKDGATTPFNGNVVKTNDPGLAMITGRCADIGRTSVPQIRGMAGHAPYFSNGSAATVQDVVRFYSNRFQFEPKLSEGEIQDLSNFLLAL